MLNCILTRSAVGIAYEEAKQKWKTKTTSLTLEVVLPLPSFAVAADLVVVVVDQVPSESAVKPKPPSMSKWMVTSIL